MTTSHMMVSFKITIYKRGLCRFRKVAVICAWMKYMKRSRENNHKCYTVFGVERNDRYDWYFRSC